MEKQVTTDWVVFDKDDPKTFPRQWERVIGFDPDRFEPFAITFWYLNNGDTIQWSWNGTSGYGIMPPRLWKYIDHPENL